MTSHASGTRTPTIENRLRALRREKGLSQEALAGRVGLTRQAIYAIETNEYLPSTAVALRLAEVLGCRVEDIFSFSSEGETVQGELVDWPGSHADLCGGGRPGMRVKVARVGDRLVVRPVAALGDVLNFTVGADGLLVGPVTRDRHRRNRVSVRLLRDPRAIEEEIVVAGCDPSIFLLGEHLRRFKAMTAVIGWTMGSGAALKALQRGDVHVAGVHVLDASSGECNLPYVRRHLRGQQVKVVTFATWTQGLMVARGNPKGIRAIEDLARRDVVIVNREPGAGARLLLDQRLAAAGVPPGRVKGHDRVVRSHVDVARLVASGLVDVGVGVEAAARFAGLDFVPFQSERYDLVMPAGIFHSHGGLSKVLDTLVTRSFRAELEALGGYDTTDTGKEVALSRPHAQRGISPQKTRTP